jgi:hypothetical protein
MARAVAWSWMAVDGSYHLSQTVNFVHKNDHQWKYRRLLLIISMSFGELLFSTGIIQREKTRIKLMKCHKT